MIFVCIQSHLIDDGDTSTLAVRDIRDHYHQAEYVIMIDIKFMLHINQCFFCLMCSSLVASRTEDFPTLRKVARVQFQGTYKELSIAMPHVP